MDEKPYDPFLDFWNAEKKDARYHNPKVERLRSIATIVSYALIAFFLFAVVVF